MGMSDILGPLRYSENEEDVFWEDQLQRKSMSDETAKLIDQELENSSITQRIMQGKF